MIEIANYIRIISAVCEPNSNKEARIYSRYYDISLRRRYSDHIINENTYRYQLFKLVDLFNLIINIIRLKTAIKTFSL